MNVGIPGVGVNVTIADPLNAQMTTTHTTTTTTMTTNNNTHSNTTHREEPKGCNKSYAMTSGDFQSALSTIKSQGFDETKLSTAKTIASKQCLSPEQITQICKEFGFEASKLDFAKFAYSRCTDQANYFKVNNVFGFSSSVEELNQYISGN